MAMNCGVGSKVGIQAPKPPAFRLFHSRAAGPNLIEPLPSGLSFTVASGKRSKLID
jgi:hypothetical protein